ncbi:MAG TPA: hypothetical protein VEI49_02580 [Terriglobales bacterium]|nr:hypothetical protein [Terriglobales bacterium]
MAIRSIGVWAHFYPELALFHWKRPGLVLLVIVWGPTWLGQLLALVMGNQILLIRGQDTADK